MSTIRESKGDSSSELIRGFVPGSRTAVKDWLPVKSGKQLFVYIVRPFLKKDFSIKRCPKESGEIYKGVNSALTEIDDISFLETNIVSSACINEQLGIDVTADVIEYMEMFRDYHVDYDDESGNNTSSMTPFECFGNKDMCPHAEYSTVQSCAADRLDMTKPEDRKIFIIGIVRSFVVWIARQKLRYPGTECHLILPVCVTPGASSQEFAAVYDEAHAMINKLTRINFKQLSAKNVIVTECDCA